MFSKKLFLFLFLFLVSIASVNAATAPDPADNLAYWALEDLTDLTGNGNTLTIPGGTADPTSGVTGIIDNAYSFDGVDDYMSLASFSSSSSFSYSMWVYPTASDLSGSHFILDSESGRTAFRIVNDDWGVYATTWEYAGKTVSANQWYHIVVVTDASNSKLYVDGVLELTTSNPSNSLGGAFSLGALYDGLDAFYEGTIDEVAIFNTALSSDEVSYLYNSGSPGSAQQYPFGEGFTHNITGGYLTPNSSVFSDETNLRGQVFVNDTANIYVNYTYNVNGAGVVTGQYTGAPSGNQYTLPVLSNTNFAQGDKVSFTAVLVNQSSGSAVSNEFTSANVTIQNRAPSASSVTWSSLTPLNDTDFDATASLVDNDGDSLNVSYEVYKNGVLDSSNTLTGLSSGSQTLFTITAAETQVGENWSYNITVTDGFDTSSVYYSPNATVTDFTFPVNITNIYFTPNVSVYNDESNLRANVVVNDTTSVAINYTYYVNGASVANGVYSGSPVGSTYELPILSSSNFENGDIINLTANAVNSSATTQAISASRSSPNLTVDNRNVKATLSWSSLTPLNDTSIQGFVTPSDADGDILNISYTINKNNGFFSQGTYNGATSPYGTINIFNISDGSTNVGDNFTFNISINDGFSTQQFGPSAYTEVVDSANFTVFLTDDWNGAGIDNYGILFTDPINYSVNYENSTCGVYNCYIYDLTNNTLFNDSLINYSYAYNNNNTIKIGYFTSGPSVPYAFFYMTENNGITSDVLIYKNDTNPLFFYDSKAKEYATSEVATPEPSYTNATKYYVSGESYIPVNGGITVPEGYIEDNAIKVNRIQLSPSSSYPLGEVKHFILDPDKVLPGINWSTNGYNGPYNVHYYFGQNNPLIATSSSYITPLQSNRTMDVTISAPNYFDKTFFAQNLSTNIVGSLRANIISFEAKELITNNTLANVTFTIDGQSYDTFNLSSGTYTVTASKTGYYDQTKTFSVGSKENKTITVNEMSQTIVNVSAIDGSTGNALTSFNGWLYNINEDYNISFNSSSQYEAVSAIVGEHILFIESDGYVVNSSNTNYFTTTIGENSKEFVLYPTKKVEVTIFKESDLTLLTGTTITLNLVGENQGTNVTTSNGTYTFTNVTPDQYSLEYSAPGYTTRYYYFTVNNNNYFNLSLYLLSDTAGSDIGFTVIDEDYSNVAGAIIKALKYDSDSGTYFQVTTGSTNSEGDTTLRLIKNSEFYKFAVQKNGQTLKITNPEVITKDNYIIPVSLDQDLFANFFEFASYEYDLNFNTKTNNFRFDYNDVTNAISTRACLTVYKIGNDGSENQYNRTCSTSNSATLLAGVNPINGTKYVAKATYDGQIVARLNQEFGEEVNLGRLGWFLQILLTLAFVLATMWNVSIMPVGVGASLVFGKLIGFASPISWGVVASIMVVSLIITYFINKNRG